MNYQGGKFRHASEIGKVITTHADGRSTYLEPFVGAANVLAEVADRFTTCHAADLHPDLVLMWQAVQAGWDPPIAVDQALYENLRHAPPSALRGFVGFGCSFGGRWFGGYATNNRGDDYCGAARRKTLRAGTKIRDACIRQADYRDLTVERSCVVYCDPPYRGTTHYSGLPVFDHDEFWATAEKWSRVGAVVLVSEFEAPAGWEPVWQKSRSVTLRRDSNTLAAVERLFVWAG